MLTLAFEVLMDYPRVTEILRYFSGYDNVPEHILDKAAARGSSVHAICAGLAKGAWIPDGMIKDNLLGYVNSFRKWAESTVKQFSIVEQRYFDDERKFSGQVDMVVHGLDDQFWLVDLKTSRVPHKTHPVQMAAYKELLSKAGIIVVGAHLVYLNPDGDDPHIVTIKDFESPRRAFECALFCWNYFNPVKTKKGSKDEQHNSLSA